MNISYGRNAASKLTFSSH